MTQINIHNKIKTFNIKITNKYFLWFNPRHSIICFLSEENKMKELSHYINGNMSKDHLADLQTFTTSQLVVSRVL